MKDQVVHTIVSSDEGITVLILQLAVNVFFSLFQRNVHVTVETCKNSCRHKFINSLALDTGNH